MNAIQPSGFPPQPEEPRRMVTSKKRRKPLPRHPYKGIAIETLSKLAVNLVLCGTAIAALGQLLSYHLSQQTKLGEIQREVKQTEKRVNELRNNFNTYFDPQQAKSMMEGQSYRTDPAQRRIILLDKKPTEEEVANP